MKPRFSPVMRCLSALVGLAAFVVSHAAAAAEKPNIVFIISDDHAWTDYGFMGHQQIGTPNLDRLAARIRADNKRLRDAVSFSSAAGR